MNYSKYFKKVLALAGVLLLFSGCSMFPEEEAALDPPLIKPAEITYTTEEAVTGTISEEVSDSCTVVASTQYSLSFGEQSGVLRSKDVSVGTAVKKGQVLAKLDCGNAEAQLANAEINLKIQKVNLERALAKGLPDTDKNGNKVNFDAQIAQLQIDQIELQISELKKTIDGATIYAPVDGVVTFMTDSSIGDTISSRTAVCQVADVSRLEFEYVGSKAKKLKLGMDVTLTIDGKEYTGKVSATQDSVPKEKKADFDSKVRITLSAMPEVSVGETVSFKAITAVKENTVIVPKGAVTGYSGSYYVRVYQDGIVTERSVEVGVMNSSQTEILKGVDAGEQVVIK